MSVKSLWNRIRHSRSTHHAGRHPYGAIARIPDGLDALWLEHIKRLHPGSGVNTKAVPHVAAALFTYFDCLARTDRPCAPPSLAVQVLWDAWSSLDRSGLDRLRAHHFPSAADADPARTRAEWEQAAGNCLVQARIIAGIPPVAPVLPALFLLDQQLALPGGHGWIVSAGRVGYAKLDARGQLPAAVSYPDVMAPAGLLLAGLISTTAFNDYFATAHAAPHVPGHGRGDAGGGGAGEAGGGEGCGGDGGGGD